MAQRIWVFKRLVISTFLLIHLVALVVYNIPACAIRDKLISFSVGYLYPLGLWQNWAMFAPNPVQSTLTLEALAVDKNGMMRNFAFPKMADFTYWQGIGGQESWRCCRSDDSER